MDTKSRNEECPCDEIQTNIEFLMIENNHRQEEIARHDTRLDGGRRNLYTGKIVYSSVCLFVYTFFKF